VYQPNQSESINILDTSKISPAQLHTHTCYHYPV